MLNFEPVLALETLLHPPFTSFAFYLRFPAGNFLDILWFLIHLLHRAPRFSSYPFSRLDKRLTMCAFLIHSAEIRILRHGS